MTCVVDGELIAQIDSLVIDAAHLISARRNEVSWDEIDAVRGGIGVAAKIVCAIPPNGVGACCEPDIRDQVANPVALCVIDDQRNIARRTERELDWDRRIWRRCGAYQCRFQIPRLKRRQAHKLAKPNSGAVPSAASQVWMRFIGNLRETK